MLMNAVEKVCMPKILQYFGGTKDNEVSTRKILSIFFNNWFVGQNLNI